jgi:hypothetical protein
MFPPPAFDSVSMSRKLKLSRSEETHMNTNTIQIGRAMLDAFNARDLNAWAAQLSDDYTGSYPSMRDHKQRGGARLQRSLSDRILGSEFSDHSGVRKG